MKSECYIDTDSGESELHKLVNVLKPKSNNKIVLLMRMNGCGHCDNMQGDWESMVDDLVKNKEENLKRNNAYISRIESGNLHNIPQQYHTSGFPHIVYINNDKIKDTYNGPRVKDEMEKWVTQHLINEASNKKRKTRHSLHDLGASLFGNGDAENIKFKIHTQNTNPKKKRKGKSKKKRDSGKKMMKSLSKILKKGKTKKSFNPTKKINSAYYATGGWRWSATKSKSNSAKTRTEKKSKKKSKKSSKNTSKKTKQ